MKRIQLLVDLENVQPEPEQVRHFVEKSGAAWIFHGANQKKLLPPLQALGDWVTLVPTSKPGKNSLDFHLVFYLGYLTSRYNEFQFVVLSKDKGYDPAIAHACLLGLNVVRRKTLPAGSSAAVETAPSAKKTETVKKTKAAKKVTKKVAKKAAKKVAKSPGTTAAAAKPPKRVAAGSPTQLAKTSETKSIEKVIKNLREHTSSRPRKRNTLERHIQTVVGGSVAPDVMTQLIAELVRRGEVKFIVDKVEYKAPAKET